MLTSSRSQSLLLFLLLFFFSARAQVVKINPGIPGEPAGVKSAPLHAPLAMDLQHSATGDKWAVSVRPVSSRTHHLEALHQIKAFKQLSKPDTYRPGEEDKNARAVTPKINANFEANWSVESTPPDNSLAISNGGLIVSANNDGIEYYTASGQFLYFDYWADFFNDNALTSSLFDPKVIYDPSADRFVLIVLHGSSANTSKVLVCFSKTNNPQGGWWVYTLTGNPLSNNCWFDYPSLGVSNNEIYITGNLFNGGSFNQAVIYQIPKAAGYAGQSLDWQYWSDLSDSPYEAFTLVPASYGHGDTYGPGIYLVSNESTGDNRIRLWDLTDDMEGTPQLLSYTISTQAYSPAADAYQQDTDQRLDNGDCRIQNAFYLNGIIHFVFHSDIGDGWNGINYNRLTVNNNTNLSGTFGLQGSYDYSYPAVAPFSTSTTDLSVMIAFLRSSEDSYPQVRVVNCDQTFTWSPSTLVKAGETFVDFLSGDTERWGDYTGIARRHNSGDARIWVAGSYGADIASQSTDNTYKTWIAEVTAGAVVNTDEAMADNDLHVFPNPTYDLVHIRFTTDVREEVTIELLDVHGRIVRRMYQDIPRTGENKLTFNKGALTPGTYYVSIRTAAQSLKHEAIVILD